MNGELKEKLEKAREAFLALSQIEKDEYLKTLTEKHGSDFVSGFMTFMENGDFSEESSEEEMKALFDKAKDEYLAMSDEDKKAYMDTFSKEKGESAAQAFLNYIEKGDFAEMIENIAELEPGKVEEGGTTMEEKYDRSLLDIVEVETEEEDPESDMAEASPVKSLLDQYKEEYINMPSDKRDEFFKKVEEAQGEEFATSLKSYLNEAKDFSEKVNRTVQEIFDSAVKEFSQAKNKGKYVTSLSKDFSESTSEGIVSYLSGELNDFSILKAAVEVHYAMRNFAEDGSPMETEPEEKPNNSEKFQNNEYLDILVEKYKNLDDDAKSAMETKMRASVGDDLTDYIIDRSKGEDFAEEGNPEEKPLEEKEIDSTEPPKEPSSDEVTQDYDTLSAEVFGSVYETNPIEESKAKEKEVSTDPTLPEGLVTEGGTTLEEGYDRELKEDFSELRWDSLAVMFN